MLKKIVSLLCFSLFSQLEAIPFSYTLLSVPWGWCVNKWVDRQFYQNHNLHVTKGDDLFITAVSGLKVSYHPPEFTREKVEQIIKAWVPHEQVIYLGPGSEASFVSKSQPNKRAVSIFEKTSYGAAVSFCKDQQMRDLFVLGLPSLLDFNKFLLHHEIIHIVKKNERNAVCFYREMMPHMYLGIAIDILTSKKHSLKQKVTLLCSFCAAAFVFHKQSTYALNRMMEQSADDGVPDIEDVLEDGIRDLSTFADCNKKNYEKLLAEKKGLGSMVFKALDSVQQSVDKKSDLSLKKPSWGYRLWQLLVHDPNHPVLEDRLERLNMRLARIKALNKKQKEVKNKN